MFSEKNIKIQNFWISLIFIISFWSVFMIWVYYCFVGYTIQPSIINYSFWHSWFHPHTWPMVHVIKCSFTTKHYNETFSCIMKWQCILNDTTTCNCIHLKLMNRKYYTRLRGKSVLNGTKINNYVKPIIHKIIIHKIIIHKIEVLLLDTRHVIMALLCGVWILRTFYLFLLYSLLTCTTSSRVN